jgi:hypothetical protein
VLQKANRLVRDLRAAKSLQEKHIRLIPKTLYLG